MFRRGFGLFSVLSKLSLRLNSGASTSGRAAVPGWCFHPEELHSGFCLRHANKLACLFSFGCFAKSRAGSADAAFGVYEFNIRRDSKSTRTPDHCSLCVDCCLRIEPKCSEGLLLASESLATVGRVWELEHNNKPSVMFHVSHPNNSLLFANSFSFTHTHRHIYTHADPSFYIIIVFS